MRNFEKDIAVLMDTKSDLATINTVFRRWAPLKFVQPMDYTANRMYSSISAGGAVTGRLGMVQMWFEEHEYHYCSGGYHKLYCEPEYATLFALSCPDWGAEIKQSPYVDAPLGTMGWDKEYDSNQ